MLAVSRVTPQNSTYRLTVWCTRLTVSSVWTSTNDPQRSLESTRNLCVIQSTVPSSRSIDTAHWTSRHFKGRLAQTSQARSLMASGSGSPSFPPSWRRIREYLASQPLVSDLPTVTYTSSSLFWPWGNMPGTSSSSSFPTVVLLYRYELISFANKNIPPQIS